MRAHRQPGLWHGLFSCYEAFIRRGFQSSGRSRDYQRNVAPCGSCHGGLDNKAGSPWLEGQSAVYIKAQLQAFASDARRNDISQQMRNVARQMTPEEIDAAAQYYASQPSSTLQ